MVTFNPFPEPEICTMPQLFLLAAMYGYALFRACSLISDGGELLLLAPGARFAGSVLLPLLGALPEGLVALASGVGPAARDTVSVGFGAVAGSSVLALTVLWFLAVAAGRVSIEGGSPRYTRPKGTPPGAWRKLDSSGCCTLFKTGVGVGCEVRTSARLLILTLGGYILILCGQQPAYTAWFACAGPLFCLGLLAYYLRAQWTDAASSDGTVAHDITDATVQAIIEGKVTVRGMTAGFRERHWSALCQTGDLEESLLSAVSMDEVRNMCQVLAPFFTHHDTDRDNRVSFDEFCMILQDMREPLPAEARAKMFDAVDTDQSGFINFEEFVSCLLTFKLSPCGEPGGPDTRRGDGADSLRYVDGSQNGDRDAAREDEEGETEELAQAAEEAPDEQARMKRHAYFMVSLGVALVIFFAHPMVGLISEIGGQLGGSPFYVSFIAAPLLLGGSKLAACNSAAMRTRRTATKSLGALLGAAVVNNTLCLGVLLMVVHLNQLPWKFSAETCSVVLIQLTLGLSLCFRRVHRLLDGCIALACYPASLLLAWWLKDNMAWVEGAASRLSAQLAGG